MKKTILISFILLITLILFSFKGDTLSENQKRVIKLQIGNKIAYVDGNNLTLDVPPQIINGRTMVPVRFISEGLGADVQWDGATKTVTITMDSIDALKSEIKNLNDDLTKKENLIKEKDDKIEELQINVNNLSNTKIRVNNIRTFKRMVDNKWSDFTDKFLSTDDYVYIGISVEVIETVKFNLQVNLYDPIGTLLYTSKWENQELEKGKIWNFWYRVSVKNYLIGAIPGIWKAKVLIDGKECGIVKFLVEKDESYKVDKAELIEALTCKNVVEGVPQEATQKFSKEDEKVVVYLRFKGLIDCGFRIKYVFYKPNGEYYMDVIVDLKSLGKDKESWAWGSLKIKDYPPQNLLGEWSVKVYFDENLVKELKFSIE